MVISHGCSDFYCSGNEGLAFPSRHWNRPIRSQFANPSTNQKPYHLHQVAYSCVVIDNPFMSVEPYEVSTTMVISENYAENISNE